ncbi:hypothetical protein SAMN04487911_10417 [Arenibacter nanhaiticus]|uniref:Uncharacterized protein n=1 Tax=Arenibacter nanhaiticus TaxID=558155 RepID=A0A1M6CQA2_9FLAO|nr:hypothetical protein SAMN04487911_10417 [Arenibacter nanhaiticus]
MKENEWGSPHATIYRWIYKFSIFLKTGVKGIEMKDNSSKKLKELEARIGTQAD